MMTDMKELYETVKDDPARCREEAKRLFLPENPVTQQNQGIRFLTRAVKLRDPEAMYLMGSLFFGSPSASLAGRSGGNGQTIDGRGPFGRVHSQ